MRTVLKNNEDPGLTRDNGSLEGMTCQAGNKTFLQQPPASERMDSWLGRRKFFVAAAAEPIVPWSQSSDLSSRQTKRNIELISATPTQIHIYSNKYDQQLSRDQK